MSESSRERDRAEAGFQRIAELVGDRSVALMEVCGTHTMAIGRFGLRSRMPAGLRLISGPGCPVCVTPAEQVDQALAMAREPGVVLTTFGDLIRVPGTRGTLRQERALGRDVRIVYSPMEALQIAQREPTRRVVFVGIGFETTSPTIAATLIRARQAGVGNFSVLPAFKLVPPAMEALVAAEDTQIDGFICPGHVSTIIGCAPYEPLARDHGVPCVVTGFEALDIIDGTLRLLEQWSRGEAAVEVQYTRAVPWEGNPTALRLLDQVFQVCDSRWRGIGLIPATGLELRQEYAAHDARLQVPVEVPPGPDLPSGCACGEVMRGLKVPPECALFGTACTPAHPVGPCMVSTEGACAAYHRYGGASA